MDNPSTVVRSSSKTSLLGLPFDNLTRCEILEIVEAWLKQRQTHFICTPNAALTVWAARDQVLKDIFCKADLLLVDGMGVYYASKFLGEPLREMVGAPSLFFELINLASAEQCRVFLFGTTDSILKVAIGNLQKQFPMLQIAGFRNGFFSKNDIPDIVKQIRSAEPDMLFLGMGSPQKEQFMFENRDRLEVPVCLGVGGMFDVIAGKYRLAPVWVKALCLEWLYRLLQEPGRLWKRYAIANTQFIILFMKEFFRIRLQRGIKRLLDMIIAGSLLVLLSPFLAVIGCLIKFTSRGPMFYPWRVLGRDARPFTGYKFRTMIENAEELKETLQSFNEMTGPVFKMRNDPRITKIGGVLRKFSLDELPQLWSVLKGDMSLVGPRPPSQQEYDEFELWQKRKLSVIPGITCLWQVSGRNEISDFADWAKLDLQYIDQWSLWLDLKILIKTIPAVLRGHGAF